LVIPNGTSVVLMLKLPCCAVVTLKVTGLDVAAMVTMTPVS
jgi:hypothetical protein